MEWDGLLLGTVPRRYVAAGALACPCCGARPPQRPPPMFSSGDIAPALTGVSKETAPALDATTQQTQFCSHLASLPQSLSALCTAQRHRLGSPGGIKRPLFWGNSLVHAGGHTGEGRTVAAPGSRPYGRWSSLGAQDVLAGMTLVPRLQEQSRVCRVERWKGISDKRNDMNETQRHGSSKMSCSHSGRSRAGGDPAGKMHEAPAGRRPQHTCSHCLPCGRLAQCRSLFRFLRETRNLDIYVKFPDF